MQSMGNRAEIRRSVFHATDRIDWKALWGRVEGWPGLVSVVLHSLGRSLWSNDCRMTCQQWNRSPGSGFETLLSRILESTLVKSLTLFVAAQPFQDGVPSLLTAVVVLGGRYWDV